MLKFKRKLNFYQIIGVSTVIILLIPVLLSWFAYIFKWAYKLPINPNSATILAGITGMIGSVIGGLFTLWGVKLTLNEQARQYIRKEYTNQLPSVTYLINQLTRILRNIQTAREIMKPDISTGKLGPAIGEHLINSNDWDLHIMKVLDTEIQSDLWDYWSITKMLDEDISKDTMELSRQISNETEESQQRMFLELYLNNIMQRRRNSWRICFTEHEKYTKEMLIKLEQLDDKINKELKSRNIHGSNLE